MKNLSRILIGLLCFAPVSYVSAGPVATTAGSNLTAFNPSNAQNNQWATMSNGRYDANNTTAKVDFGNCNAVILRCAQPKCGNGGCGDISVASAIVAGCVQSNDTCKQYGNDLVQYMSAQLVASSTAKINEQNAAAQQAAAAAAVQQSQQQMQQMQQQMQQMQQQMADQQAQSQQQLQAALAQQAAQSQAAIESMRTAATDAAMQNEAGISAYQQEAINRGISTDILERQKITGQVMTEIENAETSLKEAKVAMSAAFEYAGCDTRGNNCSGPKRVKKWRELASEFTDPYNNTIDRIYDALTVAQGVGVDLTQIYMMLNNSCNSWGQYMCPHMANGQIVYEDTTNGQKGTPKVCSEVGITINHDCARDCFDQFGGNDTVGYNACIQRNNCGRYTTKNCQPCTLLKILAKEDEVYEGWVNADTGTGSGNTTVVACASGALDSAKIFTRRTKNKNGANLVDIDMLELWLDQYGPDKKYEGETIEPYDYCYNPSGMKEKLRKSTLSKSVDTAKMFCREIKSGGKCISVSSDSAEAAYIDPVYAICDAHRYNVGNSSSNEVEETPDEAATRCTEDCANYGAYTNCKYEDDELEKQAKIDNCKKIRIKKTDLSEMKEIIGLKTTVLSQQLYKQYDYLNATLRRLKTQLEKAVVKTNLEAAGAKSEDGSSSGLLGASSKGSQYRSCTGKTKQGALECLRENYSLLESQVNNKKCDKSIRDQLKKDTHIMATLKALTSTEECDGTGTDKCSGCLINYNSGLMNLDSIILDEEAKRQGKYYQ